MDRLHIMLTDDSPSDYSVDSIVSASDLARIEELKLTIAANKRAQAHSRNTIVQRQCAKRIAEAQAVLEPLEHLAELAARFGTEE